MTKEWNAGQPKGRWDPEPRSDAEDRAIQRGIDATMHDVIKDRGGYNPNNFSMADPPAKRGTGWLPETPITPPMGQDLIKALCDEALPHGPTNANSPLRKVAEEVLAKLKAAQTEEPKK